MLKIILFIFISIIITFLYCSLIIAKRTDEWSDEDDSRA